MPAFLRVCWCRLAVFRGLQDLKEVGSGPLVVCSLPFARFLALCLSCRLQIWLYFAILGGFSGFRCGCVYLYGLRALRGLCGFCARVELGG